MKELLFTDCFSPYAAPVSELRTRKEEAANNLKLLDTNYFEFYKLHRNKLLYALHLKLWQDKQNIEFLIYLLVLCIKCNVCRQVLSIRAAVGLPFAYIM